MKQYNDQRINTILNNLEFDMKKEEEYNYRDIDFEIKELCNNVNKVVDYVSKGFKGKLYLNSNIWNICLDALVEILSIYNLKLVGSERVTEAEEVISVNEYIKRECKKYNLDANTTDDEIKKYYYTLTGLSDDETDVKTVKEKKEYLYENLLDDMIHGNEITQAQAQYFYNHFVENKSKERER